MAVKVIIKLLCVTYIMVVIVGRGVDTTENKGGSGESVEVIEALVVSGD